MVTGSDGRPGQSGHITVMVSPCRSCHIEEGLLGAGTELSTSSAFSHLVLTYLPGRGYWNPHFTGGGTEAPTGCMATQTHTGGG